jgi:hypothetical protein
VQQLSLSQLAIFIAEKSLPAPLYFQDIFL